MKKSLFLLLILTTGLTACADDEKKTLTNRILFDDSVYPISGAAYSSSLGDPDTNAYLLDLFADDLQTKSLAGTANRFQCILPDGLFGQRLDVLGTQAYPIRIDLTLNGIPILSVAPGDGPPQSEYDPGTTVTECILQIVRQKRVLAIYLSARFSDGKRCIITYRGTPTET